MLQALPGRAVANFATIRPLAMLPSNLRGQHLAVNTTPHNPLNTISVRPAAQARRF
jgi:hypothetical protein